MQKQQGKKARSPQQERLRAAAARQRKIWESEVTVELLEEKVRGAPTETLSAAAARFAAATHNMRLISRPMTPETCWLCASTCLYPSRGFTVGSSPPTSALLLLLLLLLRRVALT